MKKESRWNLANLGEYAPYFLIFKNAIEKVVREYAEHLTETLPIDKESGQPDFEKLKIQCANLKIAKDKASDLLDFYYACYLTMATKIDDVPVIPTEHPDVVNTEEEAWKEGLEASIDAGKNVKEKITLDNLRDAIQGVYTEKDIEDIKSRLPKDKEGFNNHNCEEEQEDERTNEAGEETV